MVAISTGGGGVRALAAGRSLFTYAKYINRDNFNKEGERYQWGRHHDVLCSAVDRLIDPTSPLRFLIVEMPPRHGKSEIVSRTLPAYYAGRYPHREIVVASYGSTLAQEMNQDTQGIMDRPEHLSVFPHAALPTGRVRTGVTRARNREAWQLADPQWRGGYKCVGVGQGLTGKGYSLGVIDDPVKDMQEAMSPTMRERAWQWYKSVFRTRMAPKIGAILITMTRWNHDDLAGRVLDEMAQGGRDQWERITLPAICERSDSTYEWRDEGAPLWPSRFPVEELQPHMDNVSIWSALYQQRPIATESAMFLPGHWEMVDAAPAQASRVRYWDMAATKGGGDYTVGVLIAKDRDGMYYVEDVVRGQWSPAEIDRTIRNTAEQDGQRVTVAWEEEKGASGKYVSAAMTRLLAGFVTRPVPASGSKELRAMPYSSQQAVGNVKVVKARWTSSFIAEHASFPAGKYDDQVDAASGAFAHLAPIEHCNSAATVVTGFMPEPDL